MKNLFVLIAVLFLTCAPNLGIASNTASGSSIPSSSSYSNQKEYVRDVKTFFVESQFMFGNEKRPLYQDSNGKYYLKIGTYHDVRENSYSTYEGHNVSSYGYCASNGKGMYFFNI